MPIYEFKCLECLEFFELLLMKSGDEIKMKCPKCKASNFERVLSTTNYSVGGGSGAGRGGQSKTNKCAGGSCTTYDIPGPSN